MLDELSIRIIKISSNLRFYKFWLKYITHNCYASLCYDRVEFDTRGQILCWQIVSRPNFFWKAGEKVGQNWKHPNKGITFSKSWNNWWRLNMFKATEVERKIREINLPIDMEINLSSCKTYHYYLLSLQWFLWDLLGTKNVSPTHAQNSWIVNKSW